MLLLDTHIFIWWLTEPQRLPFRIQQALNNPEHTLVLSVVSLWEMQVKVQIKRLSLPLPLPEMVAILEQNQSIQLLPVLPYHVWQLDTLPLHHRDPFDRLLIAQAKAEGYRLVSVDAQFKQYPITLF
jgi:PIN domain nuclease of toxin-antitoxin system